MAERKADMKICGQKPITGKSQINMSKIYLWSMITIVSALVISGGILFLMKPVRMADAVEITVYKSPACECCNKWADHLRDAGFTVTAKNSSDMNSIKSATGVQPTLQSCHTALVEGYVVEGHVPASDIKRLLQERPAVSGLTVPGMPMGSPGMEGLYKDPYDVLTFDRNGETKVYARH